MSYVRYKIEKQQVSYDSGVTWIDTSVTRNGEYAGTYSTLSECETGGGIPYSDQYFTIESLDDGNTVRFLGGDYLPKIVSASTDNGATWTAYGASSSGATVETIGTLIATLDRGEKVLIKGLNDTYNDIDGYHVGHSSYLKPSGRYVVYGNIMSLFYGDSFTTATTLNSPDPFGAFFSRANDQYILNLISAANLVLPATNISENCYSQMFKDCTSLTEAPSALPAMTLTKNCYYGMFHGCTSLTKAPTLPASTLAERCYLYMFKGCTSLNSVTCLATDKSASLCTYEWLKDVSSTGTFVKASNMTGWPTGDSGIPSGWTVQNA